MMLLLDNKSAGVVSPKLSRILLEKGVVSPPTAWIKKFEPIVTQDPMTIRKYLDEKAALLISCLQKFIDLMRRSVDERCLQVFSRKGKNCTPMSHLCTPHQSQSLCQSYGCPICVQPARCLPSKSQWSLSRLLEGRHDHLLPQLGLMSVVHRYGLGGVLLLRKVPQGIGSS
ncbi:hypothetical protein AVEN_200807-1 [Araneus ventricosus]|uniref:Uncharacterized protein n=1 Tax=Araneus ventricosus TaxID=182803 RepID=A0A4Y2CFC8_ARAVE|nr:hypothetical protein AVEN_200807-1 [Araneus ventricosus]